MTHEFLQRTHGGKKVVIAATDPSGLVQKVLTYRQAHGLPGADYGRVYNDVLASSRRQGPAAPAARVSLLDAVKAVVAGAKNAVGIHVDQAEMDRRTAICSKCPLVRNVAGCVG